MRATRGRILARPSARQRFPVWLSPDLLVAFRVGERMHDSYVVWHEGKAPDFVMEVASKSTWRRDRDEKPALSQRWWWWSTSSTTRWAGTWSRGCRGGCCVARNGGVAAGAAGERCVGAGSEVLGLCAYLRGPRQELRWHDPATGKDLESHDEVHDGRDRLVAARENEAAARRAAEAEVAELRTQIRRLRNEPGS